MELTQKYINTYKKSSKGEKRKILDDYCYLTKVPRNTAVKRFNRMIRSPNPVCLDTAKYKSKKGAPKQYIEIHKLFIKEIWLLAGEICAERLFPDLSIYIDQYTKYATHTFSTGVIKKCSCISLITLKRIIKEFPKGYKRRNPSKEMIYKNVPIDSNFKRHTTTPGYLEVDFVEHSGSMHKGPYAITLSYVDVCLQWHVRVACLGQTMQVMQIAHCTMQERFYHDIKEYHPDNNKALLKTLFEYALTGTYKFNPTISRSRPYKKNDNGHVEQKNGDKIRKLVGYFRYDTSKEVALLNQLYAVEDLISNFFTSSAKLIKNTYDTNGRLIKRKYDTPKTPFKRLVEHKDIPKEVKEKVRQIYQELNLVELRKKSDRIYKELINYRLK